MNILIDANIILDVLLDREPFVDAAATLWASVEAGDVKGYLAATTVTNIFYISRKGIGKDAACHLVGRLLHVFDICAVDHAVLDAAVGRAWPDFEDAVQDAAAELAGISTIVTRDRDGFSGSTRRIVDAATLVAEMARGTESG